MTEKEIGTAQEIYSLRLYVAGAMSASSRAIGNLKALCERRMKGHFDLEFVDVFQHPGLAEEQQVFAVPTLMVQLPRPRRRFIGDLSDLEGKIFDLDNVGADSDTPKEEAEDTLRAIRSGEVDALIVSGPKGEQVLTLKGSEQPFRSFLETMNKGAIALLADGTVAYSNRQFAEMVKSPLKKVLGSPIEGFVAPDYRQRLQPLLQKALFEPVEDVIQRKLDELFAEKKEPPKGAL